jgi:outer membrane autotransporter protein
VTSSGTIAPGNSPGTLNIVGTFAQTGGAFDIQFDHHAMDQLNVTGAVTLSGSPTLNLIPLNGGAGAAGVFLHSNTSITGSFGTVNYQGNGAGTLIQSANGITLLAVDGTPTVGAAFAASQTGLDFLDDVGAEQAAGLGGCDGDACDRAARHLWGRGFGRFAEEGAKDGNQPFDYRIAGTAVGGDIEVAKGFKIGASLGYSNTEEDVTQQAASADINSGLAALYANYQLGRFFVTGALSGGWQSFDLARTVTSPGGNNEADATTTGWLVGTSLQAGMKFTFPNGWQLTPSAGIAWQHQWVDGYAEHGAGAGDVSIGSHQADAIRMKAQLELSQTYHPSEWIAVSPHLKVGVAEQKNFGGTAGGSFSDGTNFDLALTDNSRTIGLAGVGVDIAFANGLTTYVDYDGQLAAGRTVNAVIGGLRYSW